MIYYVYMSVLYHILIVLWGTLAVFFLFATYEYKDTSFIFVQGMNMKEFKQIKRCFTVYLLYYKIYNSTLVRKYLIRIVQEKYSYVESYKNNMFQLL